MKTKQISNYLGKLDGFKWGPDKSHGTVSQKNVACEIRVPAKRALKTKVRFQMTKQEVVAAPV